MAHAVCFDTLAYANKLKEAGFSDKQAEIQAEALAEIFEDRVATKEDIRSLEQGIELLKNEVKQGIESLRSEMNVKFAQVDSKLSEFKTEVIKWVVGISVAQAALIISILKFFH